MPAFVFVRVLDVSEYFCSGKMTFVVTRVSDDKKENTTFEYFPINDLNLSSRELEILRHAQQGLSSKEIASKLSLSIHTVNNHRQNILSKMECNNIAQAIEKVKEHGL
jgi:DNA-binding NarL/FixJ family response regulator